MRRLTELIQELSPFLDTHGRAYCYMKPRAPDGNKPEPLGVVTELDSEPVTSLLSYRFDENHLIVPSRSTIRQALDVARGRLWATQPQQSKIRTTWSATIEAIVLSSKVYGDFTGSASKVLDHLKLVVGEDSKLLAGLPVNADQMGFVLNRVGLLLRQRNIELFRPPRRDRERLWCWRLLISHDDTSDTPDTTSQVVSGNERAEVFGQNHRSDTPDTSERGITVARILDILNRGRL